MSSEKVIPIIIPSYEPDDRLFDLLVKLNEEKLSPIILVDDGSGEKYSHYFEKSEKEYGVTLLRHEVNGGKGKALKTAFNYCLNTYENLVGCVTADSDGQHTPEAIIKIMNALNANPQKLILGVRDFSGDDIPAKSSFGNNTTRTVFRTLYHIDISDTQTGLRGISKDFMKVMLDEPTNRFEFEMRMLIIAVQKKLQIEEIPIETIYDSKENHQTHFHPIKDSIKIYSVFFGAFAKFIVSSFSSSIIDLILFQVFCLVFRGGASRIDYVIIATVLARVISATYNYLMNYFFVFKSKEGYGKSAVKYICLAIVQMFLSAFITSSLVKLFSVSVELFIKIPVDLILFLISYKIQKKFVY